MNQDIAQQVEQKLGHLRTLRDDIRVRLHLGRMELADRFRELEPRLQEVERAAQHATQETLQSLRNLGERLEKLSAELSQHEPLGGNIAK